MSAVRAFKQLARSSNAFAFELWNRVRSAEGNLALSPASVSMALAMTYGGARGETAAQMKRVLHFEEEPGALMASWGAFARGFTDPSRTMNVRIANRLFGDSSYRFEPAYVEQTLGAFGAPLEPVAFKTALEQSRARINAWVEEQTENRISELLPAGSLSTLTRLVLVNAIDFVARWEAPFNVAQTAEAPFYTARKVRPVPMMQRMGFARLVQANDAQVLELSYADDAAFLTVVLPNTRDGLPEIEASLSQTTFDAWLDRWTTLNVRLFLPRFEVAPAAPLRLAEELRALGMPLAFHRGEADFSAIAAPPDPKEQLSLADVFHKAFVRVDERGTEASGATAVSMRARGRLPSAPLEFKADHPFLFFIVDRASRLILFMGRVAEP